jgi:glycosyltransferase involved in cell wall biosynthesis
MLPIVTDLWRKGVDVRVCALYERDGNPLQEELEKNNIPVDVLGITRLKDPRNLPRLLHYLGRKKPDVIHTQLEFSNTLGSLAGHLLSIPTVSTQHTYDEPQEGTKEYRRLQMMWWSLRNFSQRIIGVSDGTRRHHANWGELDADKMTTIYNGLDLSRFQPIESEEKLMGRHVEGITVDAFVMTTVAVLREAKGIQFMLAGMPAILRAIPNAHYLIVGDGEYGDTLKTMVKEMGLENHVTFTGTRRDVPFLLALSDLFVLPTLGDALPTVLIEAMAMQLPIVASDVGGVPEMVTSGENGLLVPPADSEKLVESVVNLAQNCLLSQAMGRSGRRIAEQKFSIERQSSQLLSIYYELYERE